MRNDNKYDYHLYIDTITFIVNIIVIFLLLASILWSVVRPDRRIWPPPGRRSWQYALTWSGWCAAIAFNACLLLLDWNSRIFSGGLRFLLGISLALLGGLLASWGISTTGWTNSTGVKDGFSLSGPYRLTRNPQYVGDTGPLPRPEHHRQLATPLDHSGAARPVVHHRAPQRGTVAEGAIRGGVRAVST